MSAERRGPQTRDLGALGIDLGAARRWSGAGKIEAMGEISTR